MTTHCRTLGREIRSLRRSAGMSIRALARTITIAGHRVHEDTISNVERGRRNASPALEVAIARALDIPVERITTRCACEYDQAAA
ncbi:helix-turn-helix domain-containing protein [Actinoalloteichus sp. GBA129-24]|uniref:helix-turn-helix domain-containing protein n=1 Tax=Actinoalloteichus sp. GBA129-24 TaxID=1612551 RepID=UPI0009510568|nr:helix-turn-helix transcriptional regulator [Actinoalloteichus sp. GBA129-24]